MLHVCSFIHYILSITHKIMHIIKYICVFPQKKLIQMFLGCKKKTCNVHPKSRLQMWCTPSLYGGWRYPLYSLGLGILPHLCPSPVALSFANPGWRAAPSQPQGVC